MPKWLRRLAWAVVALLVLWLVLWLAVPPVLKWQAQKQLTATLGRAVSIGAVDFRPWSLEITLRDLTIAGASAGAAPLLHVERIHADGDWRSAWRLAPVIAALDVDAPRLNVARTGPGRYDLDDVLERFVSKPEASGPPRYAAYNIRVRDGAIAFDDRPVGRRHEVAGLLLTLPFVSSLPSQVDIEIEPRLAFTLDGTPFDTGAQSTPYAKSRETSLTLRMGDLDLMRAKPYLPSGLPVDLQRGHARADLTLHFVMRDDDSPALSLRGTVTASDIALADRSGAPLAGWKTLEVGLADVQPLERKVALGTVRFDGLDVALARDAKGRFNVLRLASAAPAEGPSKPAPWQASMQSLQLDGARVQWNDASTQPAAALSLEGIESRIGPIAWPSGTPAPLALKATLRAAGRDAARLELQGAANEASAKVSLHADGADLAAFGPYLAALFKPRVEGRLAIDATLAWAAEPAALAVNVRQASVEALRIVDALAPRGGPKRARDPLAWKRLDVVDAQLDLTAHKVSVGRVALDEPQLAVERARDGSINVLRWMPERTSAAAPAPSPPWQASLAQMSVEGGQVQWRDDAPAASGAPEPVRLDLSALRATLNGLAWPVSSSPAELQLSAFLADPAAARGRVRGGTIDWKGRVAIEPLAVQGRLRVDHLPLHAAEGYLAGGFNASVRRADLQWRGDVSLRQRPAGLEANAAGDLLLADVHVFGRDPATRVVLPDELLGWQSLRLRGVKVAMAPKAKPRIEIRDAVVSDFYSQLVVTEQGRFNLRDAAVPGAAVVSPPGGFAVGPQIAASAPSAASAPAPAASGLPVDMSVGGLQLVNGRIDYTDRLVKPNYSAALSEVNGRLGAFRTGTREMAALELHGRVAGTAQLDVQGTLNPMADPLALDVGARTTDLELAPLSPYAGKYAGYAIERGKLSMDVHYNVQPDGRLSASNHVVLNQLTFGDRIESPDATKLPVRLAVALLKDRHGVIDVNLPVSGSINDPEFSVGSIIWKVVVNLIVKVVTSPFALFSGGGGEDLSFIAFKPGTNTMADGAQAAIDKIAQALTERPSLQMTVTGAADVLSEADAIRRAELDRRVAARRRNEALRAGSPASAPEALPAGERARLVRDIYRDADLPDKPKNVLGLAKDIPVSEMEALLTKHVAVTEEAARELALQRGVAVRDALVAKGLPSERLFLAAPKLHGAGDGEAWTPRVHLSLATK